MVTTTALIGLAMVGVLGYASLELRGLYNGTPIFLLAMSLGGLALWQVELAVTRRSAFLILAAHAIVLALLVVADESGVKI
jgi:hypothetical protein